MFVPVERRPGCSNSTSDFCCLLLLKCYCLPKILGTLTHWSYLDFVVVFRHLSSSVRTLVAKNFRPFWVDLQSHLFSASFEVTHHSLQLLQRCGEQEQVIGKSQIGEAIRLGISPKHMPTPILCQLTRSSLQRYLENGVEK